MTIKEILKRVWNKIKRQPEKKPWNKEVNHLVNWSEKKTKRFRTIKLKRKKLPKGVVACPLKIAKRLRRMAGLK